MAEADGADRAMPVDNATERQALACMNDPYAHFEWSNTRIHSLPREEAEAIQLTAMNIRLDQRRRQIKILEKLADRQGIRHVATLDDMVPLLLAHDVYKSYPVSLLAGQRFDQIGKWLDGLTPYSISHVDVSHCQSIDEWLTLLQRETALDVATSSGSSGPCSFFPKSKRDYRIAVEGLRVQLAQRFGSPPTPGDIHDKIHAVTPMYRDGNASTGRFARYVREIFCLGDESYLHAAFPFRISSDMMWLAANLEEAAAGGDKGRVPMPPALLARSEELAQAHRDMPAQQSAFIRRMIEELRGQRMFTMGTSHMFYSFAKQALADGIRAACTADSIILGGGGDKGTPLPDDYEEVICEFFGAHHMLSAYGMTEMNSISILCDHGHYHVLPWVTVFLLDLETGKPLPRRGVQSGRAAFFDVTQDASWGGIITGDLATVDWDTPCACGRSSVGLRKKIDRVGQRGDEGINRAATPAAHVETADYLATAGA